MYKYLLHSKVTVHVNLVDGDTQYIRGFLKGIPLSPDLLHTLQLDEGDDDVESISEVDSQPLVLYAVAGRYRNCPRSPLHSSVRMGNDEDDGDEVDVESDVVRKP